MTAPNAKDAIKDLMSKFASGGADFFVLKDDGHKDRVRFGVSNEADLLYGDETGATSDERNGFLHPVHEIETGGKKLKVRCLCTPECPACLAASQGVPTVSKVSLKVFIPLITVKDGKWKWWERGQNMVGQLLTFIEQKGNPEGLCNRLYDVIRNGKAGDNKTTYTLIPDDKDGKALKDLPERPKLLGGLVKDWNAEEMLRAITGQAVGAQPAQQQGGPQPLPPQPQQPGGPRKVPF